MPQFPYRCGHGVRLNAGGKATSEQIPPPKDLHIGEQGVRNLTRRQATDPFQIYVLSTGLKARSPPPREASVVLSRFGTATFIPNRTLLCAPTRINEELVSAKCLPDRSWFNIDAVRTWVAQ